MERTLYLHIGLPKTASTFLQHGLFRNLSGLRTAIMPEDRLFAEPDNDRLLSSIFVRSDTIWEQQGETLLKALFGPDWQDDPRDLLLSDEAIGRSASRQGLMGAHLVALRRALDERGVSRIRILCFMRRQDRWLGSHYAQISDRRPKAGQSDFEAMIGELADPWRGRYQFGALLDYAATLATLSGAIGRDSVTIAPMEWFQEDRSALVSALAHWLEVKANSLDVLSDQAANARSSGAARWALRPASHGQKLLWAMTRRPKQIMLTPDLSDLILTVYRATNETLAKETDIDLNSLGYFG